jgi:peptide chain release factor
MTVWLQITSGRGPAECCFVVYRLAYIIQKEAEKLNLQVRVLESVPGPKPRTLNSALLAVEGEGSSQFAQLWNGTIKWIGASPFRPRHKRKNWFAGVTLLTPAVPAQWPTDALKIEVMRSSGPGGQHANKTLSAVRVTHLPTGVSAIAQEERSQHLNKKLATARVLTGIENIREDTEKSEQQKRWSLHNDLERGNAVKIFKGVDFREHRTF